MFIAILVKDYHFKNISVNFKINSDASTSLFVQYILSSECFEEFLNLLLPTK